MNRRKARYLTTSLSTFEATNWVQIKKEERIFKRRISEDCFKPPLVNPLRVTQKLALCNNYIIIGWPIKVYAWPHIASTTDIHTSSRMGIKSKISQIRSDGLTIDLHQLISDQCPNAVKASEIKNFFGRKVAIVGPLDLHANTSGRVYIPSQSYWPYRSMSIYQFMIAVRQQDGQQLMSESGETTRYPLRTPVLTQVT